MEYSSSLIDKTRYPTRYHNKSFETLCFKHNYKEYFDLRDNLTAHEILVMKPSSWNPRHETLASKIQT